MRKRLKFGMLSAGLAYTVLMAACAAGPSSSPSFYYAEPINLFFALESSSLNGDAHIAIEAAIERARKFDCGKLDVIGYTDDVAYEKGAARLSIQRAQVVRDELVRDGYRGVVAVGGRGSSDPFKRNEQGQPEQLNRRVVIGFGCSRN